MKQCPACLHDNSDDVTTCFVCGYSLADNITPDSSLSATSVLLPQGSYLKQGQYEIIGILGEGGFGITYHAKRRTDGKSVAVKELWPEKGARQGTVIAWPYSIPPNERTMLLNKFQLEAKYLKVCRHPNIVQVHEWFEENNTAYIIMDLIDGKSLYQTMQIYGQFPEAKLKHYFLQILEALTVIHNNNFLHRDIKPDNILINSNDDAVLIDFGATKEFMAGQTSEVSVTLTPGYAPLEQYSYRSKRFPSTDIYALCASMYHMITGEMPVSATDRTSVDELIPPQQIRPDISSNLAQTIWIGMSLHVEDRFQQTSDVIEALQGKLISPALQKARAVLRNGDFLPGVEVYKQCLDQDPDNGLAALELATILVNHDDSSALEFAKRATSLLPNNGNSLGILGLLHCRAQEWQDGLDALQRAVILNPSASWIQANYAWALGHFHRWDEAYPAINKALTQQPNCSFSLGVKGWIEVHLMKWRDAVKSCKRSLFLERQNPSTQNLVEWLYPVLLTALEQAVTKNNSLDLEQCVNDSINYLRESNFGLGFKVWLATKQKDWQLAVQIIEEGSVELRTLPEWCLHNLAIAYENLDQDASAINVYKIYQEQSPCNPFLCLGRERYSLNRSNGKSERNILRKLSRSMKAVLSFSII